MKVVRCAPLHNWRISVWRYLQAGVFKGTARLIACGTGLNGESSGWWIDGFVSSVAPSIGMRSGATGSGLGGDSAITCFHVGAAVALVGTDRSNSSGVSCFASTRGVREGRSALELAENSFFVGEKVADEAVGVFFM